MSRHDRSTATPATYSRTVPLSFGPTATAAASTTTSTSAVMLRIERLRYAPLFFAPNETLPTNVCILPVEMAERPEGVGGTWHPSIGVQRVVWHSGALGARGLLASATGSELCRVDFLEGEWFWDRVPYERVEAIRLEEDVMEVDVDEPQDYENSNYSRP